MSKRNARNTELYCRNLGKGLILPVLPRARVQNGTLPCHWKGVQLQPTLPFLHSHPGSVGATFYPHFVWTSEIYILPQHPLLCQKASYGETTHKGKGTRQNKQHNQPETKTNARRA